MDHWVPQAHGLDNVATTSDLIDQTPRLQQIIETGFWAKAEYAKSCSMLNLFAKPRRNQITKSLVVAIHQVPSGDARNGEGGFEAGDDPRESLLDALIPEITDPEAGKLIKMNPGNNKC